MDYNSQSYLCKLTNQILTIVGNICQHNLGILEVVKSGFVTKLSGVLENPLFFGNLEFLNQMTWALHSLSHKFGKANGEQLKTDNLLMFLVKVLKIPPTD